MEVEAFEGILLILRFVFDSPGEFLVEGSMTTGFLLEKVTARADDLPLNFLECESDLRAAKSSETRPSDCKRIIRGAVEFH